MISLLLLTARIMWRRSRRRTVLTMLAVASATTVFCTVMVVPYLINRIAHLADRSPRLVVVNRYSIRFGLPESYYGKIAKLPNVVAVNRMTYFAGIYDDPKHQFPTMALDIDNPDLVWPEYGLGRATMDAFRAAKNNAVVGVATMHRFGWRVGQQVTLKSQLYPVTLSFKIAGTYNQGPDLSAFMFRRDYLEEALHNPGRADFIWVRCSDSSALPRVAAAIDEMFHNASFETQTSSEKSFMIAFMMRFRSLAWIVEAVGLSAVVAIALAVLNTTAMNIRERRSELAVLRSLGFGRRAILATLALEAALVALAGGVLGTLAANAALNFARGAVPTLGPLLSFGLPRQVMVGGIVMALGIGIGAALAPALRPLRGAVAQSLRHLT
jgi:putative ABC transport system permease protein